MRVRLRSLLVLYQVFISVMFITVIIECAAAGDPW
jgi:hypothetical protein